MISRNSVGESTLELIDLLEKLASRTTNPNHGLHFQRLTLNHRVLTTLQTEIFNRNSSSINVSDSELLMLKRGAVFNWASLQSLVDFYRWSRISTVEELVKQSLQGVKDNSLLCAISSLRAILEISGNASLLAKDLRDFSTKPDKGMQRKDFLNQFETIVDGRLSGVRVDYSSLIKNGLRGTKKYSYAPKELEVDQTAKDLLKGIDILDKKIIGARAAYEFFSEFAHPNLASIWTNYERAEVKLKVIDIHGYVAHHQKNHIGKFFLDTFGSLITEGIEIVGECIDELQRIDLFLQDEGKSIAKHAKREIREVIKHDPAAFDSRESCPCNSKINIQHCCGKLIKTSKFGNWSTASLLH